MSLLWTLTSRGASALTRALRLFAQRAGAAPLALAAVASVAFLLSLRARRRAQPHTRRARRSRSSSSSSPSATAAGAGGADADADATGAGTTAAATTAATATKPQWLARVRVVTLGAVWSRSQRCALFCERETALQEEGVQRADVPLLPVVVRPHAVQHLRRFAALFDLYCVVRIDDDHAETLVRDALRAAGVLERGLLDGRKLLFCETDTGRISVARQLEPQLHVDETVAVISALQRFVRFVALVSPDRDARASASASQPLGSNVALFSSLASFFST